MHNYLAQYCGDFNSFYRGKCYFYNLTQSLADAESKCQSNCGKLVSIHSQQVASSDIYFYDLLLAKSAVSAVHSCRTIWRTPLQLLVPWFTIFWKKLQLAWQQCFRLQQFRYLVPAFICYQLSRKFKNIGGDWIRVMTQRTSYWLW